MAIGNQRIEELRQRCLKWHEHFHHGVEADMYRDIAAILKAALVMNEWCEKQVDANMQKAVLGAQLLESAALFDDGAIDQAMLFRDIARIGGELVGTRKAEVESMITQRDQLTVRVAELEALVVRYSAMVDGFFAVMENPLSAKDLLEFCEPVEVDDNASVEVVIVTAAPKGWAVAETDHD